MASRPDTPRETQGDPPRTEILTRRLAPVAAGAARCLDAVWDDAEVPGRLLVFAGGGVSAERFRAPAGVACRALTARPIRGDGGLVLTAEAPAGRPAELALTLAGGQAVTLAPTAPETALFEGLDCVFAAVNGEPAEALAHWLGTHARLHGMQAALLVNRLGPAGEGGGLAAALAGRPDALAGILRIVVWDVPVPVGRRDRPDARHIVSAPDAPGKARMARPDPDPWRAPLGDQVLLEAARHRFLARAGAVAFLDPSDYAATGPGDASIFALARRAPGGVIRMAGKRLYPWQARDRAAPAPGDHVCHPFDMDVSFARWCAAPARLPAPEGGVVWRPHRIIGAPAARAPVARLHRFMALRHPGIAPGRLAPKASLVEDAAAVAFVTGRLGADPVRPPSPEEHPLPPLPAGRDPRVTVVTAMKNEGPFILEWLAYHRMIGVTDVLVYTNDCTDGTDDFLKLLARKGLVEHRENRFRDTPGLKPQAAAYAAAIEEDAVRGADWLIAMDVDEFINIHVGEGHLRDLFAAIGDATLISLTWRLFGNSDIAGFRDAFVTRQFTRCAEKLCRKPHQAWGFKTLFRNAGMFRKLGLHRPNGLNPHMLRHIRWVNGSGRRIPRSEFRNAWRSTIATYGYDLATLNHYAVRSVESYLVKRDRGRAHHTQHDLGLPYWFRMNHNTTEDRSIQRMLPALDRDVAALLADPEIAAMHAAVVARHRRRIAELMETPDFAALHAALTGRRMRRLSRMLRHFGANVFLNGPDCVPDRLVEADLPADFFFTVAPPQGEQVH